MTVRKAVEALALGALAAVVAVALSPRPARASEPAAQDPEGARPSDDPELVRLNADRLSFDRGASLLLTGWSGLHLAAGAVGFATLKDTRSRQFALATVTLSVPVLASAIAGLAVSYRIEPDSMDLQTSLRRGMNLERLLFVGIALDLIVAGSGAAMWERGLHTGSDGLVGWGRAFAYQGLALLLFDSVVTLTNIRADDQLSLLIRPAGRDGVAVGLQGSF